MPLGATVERTSLRLELFVRELGASIEFYVRVLGFEQEAERPRRVYSAGERLEIPRRSQ